MSDNSSSESHWHNLTCGPASIKCLLLPSGERQHSVLVLLQQTGEGHFQAAVDCHDISLDVLLFLMPDTREVMKLIILCRSVWNERFSLIRDLTTSTSIYSRPVAPSLIHKIKHVSGGKCVVQFYGISAVSHHRGLCSIPGHSVLDLYGTSWHWDGVFNEYFIVAVCIILPVPHTNSFVTSTIWCGSWQCCCITHTSIDTSNSILSVLMMNVTLHHNTILCHI